MRYAKRQKCSEVLDEIAKKLLEEIEGKYLCMTY
jgi:hypothetical protein